ncbi:MULTISPECIES: hypothetical protein [Pseudomonas]|uniref:hypothetical protein n=1 Tax=Pseudomonas TaxID=286 RepID=UPI0021F89B35|nr:hypothetical protein [Pseudomonas putida]
MKMLFRLVRVLLLGLPLAALAAPAPWYKYQSIETGVFICTQVDPGKAFIRFAGPFRNAACR